MLRPFLLLCLLSCAAVHAAEDQPLRVFAHGAPGARVFVASLASLGGGDGTAEISRAAFGDRAYRGTVPLTTKLKPGQYLVTVMPGTEYALKDASREAHEYAWDGYDYHAIVGMHNGRWRYVQCYLVVKVAGFPAEVLAVFTDQMPEAQPLSFDCGAGTTRYAGTEEDAGEALSREQISMAYHGDIFTGLQDGEKILLRSGEDRYAVQTEGTQSLRVTKARGQGAWAGHELSIVPYGDLAPF